MAKQVLTRRIEERLQWLGLERITLDGRRLSLRETIVYGVVEGREREARDFLEAVADEACIFSSSFIKSALSAYLEQNPGAPIPDFIQLSKTRALFSANRFDDPD